MLSAMRHRGPDGEGVHRAGPATLLHTRLAIIDVAGGSQPLVSEDGSCSAVVNGEIYNHEELRSELIGLGHRFATRSDSEVVVHAYEEWGVDFLGRLNGIFAFALWDDRRGRLVAARDPLGVKPLYWCRKGRSIVVASEIAALLAGRFVEPAIDPVALDHYFTWRFVPSPRTMFAGISKLAPATFLCADADGKLEVSSYREAPGTPLADAGVDELAAELTLRFEDAVERQTMSDVPYGAFLSGGVDSTAIVAALRGLSDSPPQTFTIGFPGHGDTLDERAYAAESALLLGSEHHDTAMERDDFVDELTRAVRHLEEPCGIPSAPAALQLSRFAAEHVKVVLSGQGADEPLGGYPRHQAAAALGAAERLPGAIVGPARAAIERLPRNERLKRAAELLAAPAGLARVLRIFQIAPDATRERLLAGGPNREAAEERQRLAAAVLDDLGDRGDPLEHVLYLDTHLFMPDSLLLYGDKMSMAASLEQRVPFLDRELLSFVERIPAHLRVRRLERKWLYRRAIEGIVPKAVMERRKHAFSTPYDTWLRTSLGAQVEQTYRDRPELAAMIDVDEVSRLVAEHRSGRANNKRVLYCLLELAAWHRAFIEQVQESTIAAARA